MLRGSSARTTTAEVPQRARQGECLRRASEAHDRQVLSTGVIADLQCQPSAWPTACQRPRLCARRAARPARPRLVARPPMSWKASLINFVRRSAAERRVRPVFVVPIGKQHQFTAKALPAHGHKQAPRAIVLECPDQPFDHRDAAFSADGAKPRTDAAATAPGLESHAPELRPPVADQVFWLSPCSMNGTSEEGADRCRRRLAGKRCHAHHAPREVVDHDGHPPAERPALRHGKGEPGRPEAASDRHRRQIDVPGIVGSLGAHDARWGWLAGWRRLEGTRSFDHSSDGCRAQVQARTGKRGGDLALAESGDAVRGLPGAGRQRDLRPCSL